MLSVAYNNLAVGLFGMGLDSDLPALQLLIDRAAATVRATPSHNSFASCLQDLLGFVQGTPRGNEAGLLACDSL